MAVNLNSNQVNELQNFLQNGQFADGYNYLRDVVNQQIPGEIDFARSQDLTALSAWFDAAAHINADDGSFVSEFVRGSTEAVMRSEGSPVTDTQFQDASNQLAEKLLTRIIQNESISTAQEVVDLDRQNAVDTLNMPPWGWAGSIWDFMPPEFGGLGQDVASVPFDKMGVMSDATQMGVIRAVDRMLRDGVISTADEINALFESMGKSVYDFIDPSPAGTGIDPATNTDWSAAQRYIRPPRRDPLTLDLNNNGLETVGINTADPILFDHDGDGVKSATGWIAPSDGLLVWDKNNNGAIDSGRELFGDATLKTDGQLATDGFDALADLDSNNDGEVSSADTNFANLKIWQDLNQDGITQAGELTTLAAQNIASFNVAKTANSQTLNNGNQIADLGSYTKSDGSQATLGEVTGSLGDVNLASNPFYNQFTDTVTLTPQTQVLPDMHGSGMVRNLREAANLPTTEAATLAATLTQYATADYDTQHAMLDSLVQQWSATSTFLTAALHDKRAANDAMFEVRRVCHAN